MRKCWVDWTDNGDRWPAFVSVCWLNVFFFALSIHSRAVQVALRAPHDVQGRDGLVKDKRLFVECADKERYHTRSTYVC